MARQSLFKKSQPLIVWGVGDIYFILAVTVIILFGMFSPDLQKQLNFSNSQLGLLGFGFFLSFGVTQLLTGGLMDSWGPRIVLVLSGAVASLGLFLFSTAQGITQAFIAQVITGAGFSISYVGAIYLASVWFSQKHFSLFSGITQMSANVISASVVSVLVLADTASVNFRTITAVLSGVTLLVSLLLALFVQKAPVVKQNKEESKQKSEFWKDLYKLLHIPQFWLGSGYYSANIGVFLAFSSLWNIPDSLAYGHDLKTATMMSATLRLGGGVGALVSGWFVGSFGRGPRVARWYNSGSLLFGVFLIYGPVFPVFVTFLLFALLGFFLGGSAQGFPLVGKYIPSTLKGTGFGLMAAMGYLLCASLQYGIGVLLRDRVLSDSFSAVHIFKIALTPLIITLAIGWLCTLYLRDVKNFDSN